MFESLTVVDLRKSFGRSSACKEVLRGVDLTVRKGECLGIVGESGCGKTTLASCIAGLLKFDGGDIFIKANSQSQLKRETSSETGSSEKKHIKEFSYNTLSEKQKSRLLRTYLQLIFQNPGGSLHPRKKIRTILKESINDINRLTKRNLVMNEEPLLEVMSFNESILSKYPDSFSGGEKQRICLVRALLVEPALLIADEPLSNMDVTTQARILNYFKQLNLKGITIIFITHDLSSAQFLCDSIAIMKYGKIIEKQKTINIFEHPLEDYTKDLIKMNANLNHNPAIGELL